MGNQTARLWIGKVEAGVKSVELAISDLQAPYEGAHIAVQGFTDAVFKASWQWKITEAMQELVSVYRFNEINDCQSWREGRFILRQRRIDRRYKFTSFFRLYRMAG